MKIQSLSVVVPSDKCVNNCKFCVAHMKKEEYKNQMNENLPFYDLYLKDYIKRLEFARDNGCNTLMLTGNAEPQQNRTFLTYFGLFMMMMDKPFRNIEMQTSGVLLNEPYLRFLRNHVGINTISLSLSALDDGTNTNYNGIKSQLKFNIKKLCSEIKKYDFNLRLSLNLTDFYNTFTPFEILKLCKDIYGADQVTFRVLYQSGMNTIQDQWIQKHAVNKNRIKDIKDYVVKNGEQLDVLEYGAIRYSINGMSIVVDDDCMSKTLKQEYKYLILRPNCKLYSKWDDPASIIF